MTTEEYRFRVAPERAQAEAQLIRIWEALEPYAGTAHATPTVPDTITTPEAFEAVHMFANLFAEELDVVHRARNSIVHAKPVSDENLGAAIAVGERLWEILRNRLTSLDTKPLST